MLAPPQDERVYCPYANALSINQTSVKPKSKRRGIQSIDTGIRLLEVLEKAEGPLALKDLSARAELDPSSAHRYLTSFVRCGLVRQEPDARYDFGPLALRIGLTAMQRLDPIQVTERALPDLVAETLAAEAKRESVDREAFARVVERAKRMRLAYVDSSVIPGLSAISSPV